MCRLHFLTVKKQPIISCNTVVTSVVTLLLGFQLMKYFPPGYNYLSLLFFLLFSPFIFHPHANDWLNGHPCFWSFQEWATKVLTHILLDPVSKLWTPRSHFLTTTPEWAEELSLLYWGGIGAWRRRQWHPTPVLLPGKSHGWRSLVGCSLWGPKESDTTEWLHFHFSLSCIGEGNGNPLQGSCLENPRDGGAGWTADYGVAQSRTRLKRLSNRGTECHVE